MNEIVRIHIAGVPYEIDVAAKKSLEKYLSDIRASLGAEAEAIEDIEIRITEILGDRGVRRNGVIKEADIKAVKSHLGKPADFESAEKHDSKQQGRADEPISERINREFAARKYFRDTENGILGGVIAGLAAYTKWDLTLLRLLFVLLLIFTGIFPFAVAYLVVWIVAPEARTSSEKLEMRGEPVNIESLKNTAAKVSDKAKTSAKKVSRRIESDAPQIANTALRVILIIFGVIGFCTFIPALIAIIPAIVIGIVVIAAAAIPAKGLFVATAILCALLAITIIALGIAISAALVTAKLNSAVVSGFVASCVFAAALTIAACTTAVLWTSRVSDDQIRDTFRSLVDETKTNVRSETR